MIRQIAPYIIEAAGELVKDTLRTYVDSKAPKGPAERVEPLVTIIEPPEQDTGCPYCTITRYISYAHRLVVEAKLKPHLAELLCEAAGKEVSEAVAVMHRLNASLENSRLTNKLHRLEVTLLRPLKPDEIDRVAADLWALTDLCLDIALVVEVSKS